MADRERRTESRPTIRVPAEPGIPAHAPDCARHVAFALDRITGGHGRWAYDSRLEEAREGSREVADLVGRIYEGFSLLGAEGLPQAHPEDL